MQYAFVKKFLAFSSVPAFISWLQYRGAQTQWFIVRQVIPIFQFTPAERERQNFEQSFSQNVISFNGSLSRNKEKKIAPCNYQYFLSNIVANNRSSRN